MPSMSCATYHQNCRYNGSTTFTLLSYERSRRMVELREETGAQRSLTESLVRSRLQWAGHVEMMADDRPPKSAAELREEGRRRQGRPRARREDLREMCRRQERRKTGRRRQETEEGGKYYQMSR